MQIIMERYHVTEYTGLDMICAAWGGDVVEIVNGRRIWPGWWLKGIGATSQAEGRRAARLMRTMIRSQTAVCAVAFPYIARNDGESV